MKLDRLTSGACAALAVASLLSSGCSPASAASPASSAAVRSADGAAQRAMLDEHAATTQLMSAQVAGPAPKVGRSHLTAPEPDADDADDAVNDPTDQLGATKGARRSDGSRRGGHFGTSK